MKRTCSGISVRTFVAVNIALMGIVAGARGDTYNFLGSSTSSWVGYAGAPVPTLVTTTPGSIVDAVSAGSSYGRMTNTFAAFPGEWRIGDAFTFHFDGIISNNTAFQAEFTDTSHLVALQLVMVNAASAGGDLIQVKALGGSSALLFTGNIGGAAGVGVPQHVVSDLTLSILTANSASLSGSVLDNLGNLWTGDGTTVNLGTAPSALYAGVNLNASAGVGVINGLEWTLTPVPEPSTAVLFGGLGLAALVFGRRLRRSR